MDPRHLSRLYEEQSKAIQETKERIQKYEQFKSDYKALQQRLKTLPDKVSHDVMVPFGKFAFMPGQIVHTNEILVLLGDNWFAERSAKQAYQIADRRIQELDSRIKDLKEQHDLLAPRLGITSDLQTEAQDFGDIKEIVEEYDEEKERLWDEQHRKNVKKYHAEQTKKTVSVGKVREETKSDDNVKSDEDLWKRLDALEILEAEKGELHSSFEEESEDEEDKGRRKSSGQRVSWVDEKIEVDDGSRDSSSGDEDAKEEHADSLEDSSDKETMAGKEVKRVITFTHTKTPVPVASSTEASPVSDPSSIRSPADIYKVFAPKSILKKSHPKAKESGNVVSAEEKLQPLLTSNTSFRDVNIVDESNDVNPKVIKKEEPSCTKEEKAFTGLVVEKPIPQNLQTTTLPQPETGVQAPKRTSKFRAQRMKQNPS